MASSSTCRSRRRSTATAPGASATRWRAATSTCCSCSAPPNLYYLTGFESIWYPPRAPVGVIVAREDDDLRVRRLRAPQDAGRAGRAVRRRRLLRLRDGGRRAVRGDPGARAGRRRGSGWSAGRWRRARRWSTASPTRSRPPAPRWSPATGSSIACAWSSREAELVCVRRAAEIVDAAVELAGRVRAAGPHRARDRRPPRLRDGGPGRREPGHPHDGLGRPGRLVPHPLTAVDAAGRGRRRDVRRRCGVHQPLPRRCLPHLRDRPRPPRGPRDPRADRHSVDGRDRGGAARRPARRRAVRWPRSTSSRASPASRCGGWAATRWASRCRPTGSATPTSSNDAFEQFTWEPGYVTNYENILFDREAGFTASYMETLLMGPERIEMLSTLPRELTVLRLTARRLLPPGRARPRHRDGPVRGRPVRPAGRARAAPRERASGCATWSRCCSAGRWPTGCAGTTAAWPARTSWRPCTTPPTSRCCARPASRAAACSRPRRCSPPTRGSRCWRRPAPRWRRATPCSAASTKLAYALVRPPGHHAGPASADGYCFFNNVALVARARARGRLRAGGRDRLGRAPRQRHPGLLLRPRRRAHRLAAHAPRQLGAVATPQTGSPAEVGVGAGAGHNVNAELRPGLRRSAPTSAAFDADRSRPILRAYRPDLIVGALRPGRQRLRSQRPPEPADGRASTGSAALVAEARRGAVRRPAGAGAGGRLRAHLRRLLPARHARGRARHGAPAGRPDRLPARRAARGDGDVAAMRTYLSPFWRLP